MTNATLTVGSQFTTQKSGVSGTIQEVIQNKSGSLRVRLDVNGQDRWTTVKQFSLWGVGHLYYFLALPPNTTP